MSSTPLRSATQVFAARGEEERRRISVKIRIQEDIREKRDDIPGDLWSMIQTLTDNFPNRSTHALEDDAFYLELENALETAESCFRVFRCRYSGYNQRGLRPVVHKVFEEIIKLIKDTMMTMQRISYYKGRLYSVVEIIRENYEIYNNLILVMTQSATYNNTTISDEWAKRINTALSSGNRRTSKSKSFRKCR